MSDKGGILGEILEEGGSLVKQTVKQVAKTPGDLAKAGAKQVKGAEVDEKAETKQLVKDIYKPQEENTPEELLKKQAEDKKKEAQLRNALHSQYYQGLVNRPKPPEEKPAEKVEREKKEERWELEQKEKKKPPPLAIQRAQKVEKYPGASG